VVFTCGITNLTGMDTCTNFYLRVLVRVRISTRSLFTGERVITLSDPNPTRCHPYARNLLLVCSEDSRVTQHNHGATRPTPHSTTTVLLHRLLVCLGRDCLASLLNLRGIKIWKIYCKIHPRWLRGGRVGD
jgi:hypothetical protein